LSTGRARHSAHPSFERFAEGWSTQAIAKELNDLGVKTARGGTWSHSAIYGHEKTGTGLLNDTLYIGKRRWNRPTFDKVYHDPKNPDDFKLVRREKDESEWIVTEQPHLRIVSQELWDRVKARQKVQFEKGRNIRAALHDRARTGRGPGYLLPGILLCGSAAPSY
jgi:site-specific DNA recombinase